MSDPTSAGTRFGTEAELQGQTIPPGGPLSPTAQGFENPGRTPNLRGVETNTDPSKGSPAEKPEVSAEGHGATDGDSAIGEFSDQSAETHEAGVPVPPGYGRGRASETWTELGDVDGTTGRDDMDGDDDG